jgi:hypothetical protein
MTLGSHAIGYPHGRPRGRHGPTAAAGISGPSERSLVERGIAIG